MEGDKPILRMAEEPPEDPTTVSESTIKPAKARSSADSYEKMLKDMSLLIDWLVEDFGYDVVPEVHRRTDTKKKIEKKALRTSNTNFPFLEKRLKKGSEKHKRVHSLRTKPENDKRMSQDPTWMSDLKAFIKDLVSRFGQEDLDRYTKPVMAALEKKHNIRVTDIDGEIHIDYVDNVKQNAGTPIKIFTNDGKSVDFAFQVSPVG
ncbi:uncharacterized protein LOC113495379 isoform X2 [Trichoplusia ni]|uniref:Uncharacterized protein LOC113495379 isoform X2 n=1 Tax=Trichoplusia ni TaxID=7111 RepID=A0A7E5VNL5_TRINI|nr:uncharacterized protein LOC113495379 isoform X2 [Trichoplusia ni]